MNSLSDEHLYAGDQTSPGRFEGLGCSVFTMVLIVIVVVVIALGCEATGRPGWATTFGAIAVFLLVLLRWALNE